MAIRKLQNNYTTPDQSKRLLELGVPADSANLSMTENGKNVEVLDGILYSEFIKRVPQNYSRKRFLPCWSVGRLMEIFDICFSIKEEVWPTTTVMTKTSGSVIEYLVCTFEMQPPCKLDFSKLEE